MKVFLIALTALAPVLCAAQVDWKLTVAENLLTDLRQTMSFAERDVEERNPFWKPLHGRPEFPIVFTAAQALTFDWIEKQKRKSDLYMAWALAQMFLVHQNRQQTGYGVPVISVRF